MWLALVIGNTRLHWAIFAEDKLLGSWHTPHLMAEAAAQLQRQRFQSAAWRSLLNISPASLLPKSNWQPSSLWIASVVPAQTALWTNGSAEDTIPTQVVTRSHIPLSNLYSTLGIDRAINLLGAGTTVGWPVLVIDGGTALTLTAGSQASLWGGAILPGLRLQTNALTQGTAALAEAVEITQAELWERATLPERWATDTVGAIASGLSYGILSTLTDYLNDWWQQFPTGNVIFTGGDSPLLHALFTQHMRKTKNIARTPEIVSRVQVNSDLMFWGMWAYRRALTLVL